MLAQIRLVDFFDGVPIEGEFLGDIGHGRRATPPADVRRKPRRAKRIGGEPVEFLRLHAPTPEADHPTDCEREEDGPVAAGEIADSSQSMVVNLLRRFAATAADYFWGRW